MNHRMCTFGRFWLLVRSCRFFLVLEKSQLLVLGMSVDRCPAMVCSGTSIKSRPAVVIACQQTSLGTGRSQICCVSFASVWSPLRKPAPTTNLLPPSLTWLNNGEHYFRCACFVPHQMVFIFLAAKAGRSVSSSRSSRPAPSWPMSSALPELARSSEPTSTRRSFSSRSAALPTWNPSPEQISTEVRTSEALSTTCWWTLTRRRRFRTSKLNRQLANVQRTTSSSIRLVSFLAFLLMPDLYI